VPETRETDPLLSTTEVGELFDVHASTVKRWCDREDLAFTRTEGGHRRIPLSAALRLARKRRRDLPLLGFEARAAEVWSAREAAREDDLEPTRRLLLRLVGEDELPRVRDVLVHLGSDESIDLAALLDRGLRPVMREVGERWERGEVTPGVEHMVSETMVGALHQLRESGGRGPAHAPGSVALVGSLEGERHDVGARCVRVLLERSGWEVRFLGADVPMEEWAVLQRSYGARMICVSLSQLRGQADALRCVRRLADTYDRERPYVLALGGAARVDAPPEGSWPFTALRFFPGVSGFAAWLGEAAD